MLGTITIMPSMAARPVFMQTSTALRGSDRIAAPS